MRWTQVVLLTRALSCGRRSRVVLTPRRWCQVRERKLSRATVAKTPGAPGRTRIIRKPLRGECRVIPVYPTNACALYHYHCIRGLRAHRAPGIPCALFSEGAGPKTKLEQKTCCEIAKPCLYVSVEAMARIGHPSISPRNLFRRRSIAGSRLVKPCHDDSLVGPGVGL